MTKKILLMFFLSRFLFLGFAFLAPYFIPLREGYLGNQFNSGIPYLAWVWANFDGRHFLDIAMVGYQKFNFVYFPLYPLLVFLFSRIIQIPLIYIGIFISAFVSLISSFVFYKLVKLDLNNQASNLALMALFFFPTSFYFHSVYYTSLLFLFICLSFLMARKKRWFWSGIFGALATLSHLTGIIIVPALAVEWWQDRKKFPFWILSILGICAYMLFLRNNFGDPFLFFKSFTAWHRESLTFPLQVVFRYLKIFLVVNPKLLVYWVAVLEFITFILLLALSVVVWKKLRASYAVLMICLIVMSSLSGSFIGMPRYALHLFPSFIAIGLLLQKRKKLQIAAAVVLLILSFTLTALFTRGYFVS